MSAPKLAVRMCVACGSETWWPADEPVPLHDKCSDPAHDALRATLAAEREKVRVLREALATLEHEDMGERCADDGDEFCQCDRCGAQEWGSNDVYEPGDADHGADCPYAALAATAEKGESNVR